MDCKADHSTGGGVTLLIWIIAGILLVALLACIGLILWASLVMIVRASDVMDWTNREGNE